MSGPKRGSDESRALNKALGKGRSKKVSSRDFTDFGAGSAALKKSTDFFFDSDSSNTREWLNGLTYDEQTALKDYSGEFGISYKPINKALYTQNWKDINPAVKDRINSMEAAMDKSVLLKGIKVTRACDFKIFGAQSGQHMSIDQIKEYIKKNGTNDVLENKGFLSSGANNHGAAIDGSGLVIHFDVPPSVGAGAYINPISKHGGSAENEFLFNYGSRFKFDLGSLKKDKLGNIHIKARWIGRRSKK